MRRLRVLVLMHKDLVPPDPLNGHDPSRAEWKTEYDVVTTLRKMGHDARPLGVKSDLGVIRTAVEEWRPHIAFNLLEAFDDALPREPPFEFGEGAVRLAQPRVQRRLLARRGMARLLARLDELQVRPPVALGTRRSERGPGRERRAP